MMLVTVAAMIQVALLMALSGAALAQEDRGGADVCVSDRGETLIDIGTSNCFSDPTSQAVAVNDSEAIAGSDSEAVAVDSTAFSDFDSEALAFDSCSATALNGELEFCP